MSVEWGNAVSLVFSELPSLPHTLTISSNGNKNELTYRCGCESSVHQRLSQGMRVRMVKKSSIQSGKAGGGKAGGGMVKYSFIQVHI